MGLERVEIALDLEQRLGVQLPDDQTFSAKTIGDLAAAILACEKATHTPCPTVRTFLQLRHLLMKRAGITREVIRPRARLDVLFPARKTKQWHKLTRYEPRLLGITRLASTEVPAFQELWSLAALAFGVLTSFNLVFVLLGERYVLPYITLPVLFMLSAACYRKNNPAPTTLEFPAGLQTVGDLTRFLAPPRSASASKPEVLAERRMIIINHVRASLSAITGRPITSITEETELARDLGV